MECAEARNRLSAYLDGLVPAPERESLEAHLSACQSCGSRLSQLRGALAALRRPLPSVPERVWERILSTIEDRRRRPARVTWRRLAPRFAAAAAGFALVWLAYFAGTPKPSGSALLENPILREIVPYATGRMDPAEGALAASPEFQLQSKLFGLKRSP